MRQNNKRAVLNKQYKHKIKKLTRKMSDLVKEDKHKEAEKLLPSFYKAVDKAAKRNILHKNTASRKKAVATRTIAVKK